MAHAFSKAPFYKNLKIRSTFDDFRLDNLGDLPLTSKSDLQGRESEFLCVDQQDVLEYVTTSGTLGNPVTFMLSKKDINRLAYNEYLSLSCATGVPSDIYQIMVTLDKRFMAGMAYYLGAQKLGAAVVRTGVESLAFQMDTIFRIKPTCLIAVPSFILKLIEFARREGLDLNKSTVRKIICIGEPVKSIDFGLNTLGQRISNAWNVKLFSTYASTEMATAFTECEAGRGGHLFPDLIIPEVIKPDGQPAKPGEPGELVVTPLGVEAMPLVRFQTGDVCRYHVEPCICGRNTIRLGPIEGRRKQMIKLKGTTLYPPAIFDVLNGVSGVSNYLVTIAKDEIQLDDVLVEYSTDNEADDIEEHLKDQFSSYIRVIPRIRRIPNADLLRKKKDPMSRKPIKLIDLR